LKRKKVGSKGLYFLKENKKIKLQKIYQSGNILAAVPSATESKDKPSNGHKWWPRQGSPLVMKIASY
jgi:hypothetical protein